jgi:hypothetical protein
MNNQSVTQIKKEQQGCSIHAVYSMDSAGKLYCCRGLSEDQQSVCYASLFCRTFTVNNSTSATKKCTQMKEQQGAAFMQ